MQESGDLGLIRRGSGKGILSEIQLPGKRHPGWKERDPERQMGQRRVRGKWLRRTNRRVDSLMSTKG